jgi:hypothetical protein
MVALTAANGEFVVRARSVQVLSWESISIPPLHGRNVLPYPQGDPAMASSCRHLDSIRNVEPSSKGCEECLKMGDTWVHLRLCLACGHVGCCDSSKNKHATKHFHATQHPIVQSFEPGEDWKWCYADGMVVG